MSIQSPFSIIFTPANGGDPVALLHTDGWLAELPTFETSQNVYESDGISLGNAFFKPLGGATVQISFTVEEDRPDLIAALDAFLDADNAGAYSLIGVSGTLAIGGKIFPNAAIGSIDPALPSGPTATVARAITITTSLPI